MKKTALRAVLFAFLAAGASVAAPAFVRAAEPLVARLGNGLEVILVENHGSPMIAATMVVRAGADLETAATSGASHMMEHLLFNGTERRTQKELYDEVDLYGIYNNATTRRSHTDYFVLVSKDRIREAMDIQADMLFHSTFPAENFEKEKGIVLEEMGKDEEDPGYIAEQLFRNAAFGGTPYARPILGSRKSIAAMSREEVVRYWRATYVPSNMTLFVMGDFDAESMLAVVDSIYGAATAGAATARAIVPFSPIGRAGPIRVFHGKTEEGHLSIALLPGVSANARPGIQDALTAYIGKRLSEDLAEGDEPVAFSVGASYERRTPPRASPAIGTTKERMDGFGRMILSATFDPSRSPEEIEAALLASLRKIAESEPDPDEIERFRVSMKTSDIYLSEKPHMYGMMKAESIAEGGYDAIEEGGVALDSIGPASIRNLIARLVPENRISVAFLPGEPDYAEADLETAVPGEKPIWEAGPLPEAAPTKVAASAAPGAPSGGLAILRAPAKGGAARAARSERVDTTLANGLRIVVQSNDDSEVFAIHMLARHRSWQEPTGLSGIADCLHRLLLEGAGDSDGPALRARLERIGAEVKAHDESFIPYDDYYTTPSYSFVRFTTIDEHAEEGMDLFADIVRRPRLAEADVAAVKQEMLALARGRQSKAGELSEALLARALFGDSPRAADPEGAEGSIEAITRDDLALFHAMYFAPDNLIVTVVTSLPARAVADGIARRFDDAARFGKRKPAPPALPVTTADSRAEDSLGAKQGSLRIGYVIDVPEEDRPALQLAASILSDEIAFDLRETRGLAYGVGAGVSFARGAGVVAASIGTAPANFAAAEGGIREHLDRFAGIESIEPRELERAVNALLGRMNMRRLSRPNQAYRIGLAAFQEEDDSWADRLRRTTPGDVIRAARAYIRSSPAATVVVR